MAIKGQRRQETILYAVLWAILFAAPLLSMYIDHHTTDAAYDWQSVYAAWRLLSFFLVIFLVHNFLIAPLLVYGGKRWTYFSIVAMLMTSFSLYQCGCRPHPVPPERKGAPMERFQPKPLRDGNHHRGEAPPPRPFGGEDMVQILIVAMLLGLNIGAKAYFKSLDEREKAKDLAHEHLNVQLEYLKYQINPHFFMNTLNNIHALVEFDPEQAQVCIEVLSDLMRYMLYEANRPLASLEKELAFVRNYVNIMEIRYVDVVRVDLSVPESVPDVMVPPLLFVTFVENAFKHGVSYEQESFVEIRFEVVGDRVVFHCRNSRKPKSEDSHGGVGLKNAVQRLNLLYGDTYNLAVEPSDKEYNVRLSIPFTTKTAELK